YLPGSLQGKISSDGCLKKEQMVVSAIASTPHYQTADYALRLSVMADTATMRMKALHFWDKHGISAASEAFGVSCRTR
ncbi:hypothetical protein PU109_003350, partial [Escherichia coli]|nr:hypothetical protein [Escherichia coli]